MNKKAIKFILSTITITIFAVVCFRLLAGYYLLPSIVYQLYYTIQNDKEHLDNIEIDDDFKFYQKGYFVTREISSPYSLPHFLILHFESDIAPINIKPQISIKLEVFRKDKLVYSTVTKGGHNLFERDKRGNPLGVNAINISELPFPMEWKAYKDIRIDITVIEADEEMHKYIDKASLFLFPDIMLVK